MARSLRASSIGILCALSALVPLWAACAAPRDDAARTPELEALEGATTRIAARVGPSVVTVQSLVRVAEVAVTAESGPEPGTSVKEHDPWTYTVGTGFVVDQAEGWVLTCAALVERGTRAEIVAPDGHSASVREIYYDRVSKVAALRVDPGELTVPALDIHNAPDPRLGQWVVQVSPGAHPEDLPFVSVGMVGCLALPVQQYAVGGVAAVRNALWVNAASVPDGAGSPVVGFDGGFIGIALPQDEKMPYAGIKVIPARLVLPVYDRLRAGGAVKRAWLGVGLVDTPPEAHAERGAYLSLVRPSAPADKAGLKPGDIVVALVAGSGADEKRTPIRSSSDLISAVEWLRPGDTIALEVVRSDQHLSIRVLLGEFPDEGPGRSVVSEPGALLGAAYRDASAEECTALSVPSGVVLTEVTEDGFASAMGLQVGDVLVRANGEPIGGAVALGSLLEKLGPGGELLLDIRRHDERGDSAHLVGGRL
jgi:serine protease Do